MRKGLLVIISSILLSFSIASKIENCAFAKCLEETETAGKIKCYSREYNETSRTIKVKKCPEEQKCNFTYWNENREEQISGTQDGICEKVNPQTTDLLPLEKCAADAECASKNCTNSRCVGKVRGAKCGNHKECENGSACIDNICTQQKEKGESCKETFECLNHAGCHEGICTEYFTLDNGAKVTDEKLCKSYYAVENDDKQKVCADLTKEKDRCDTDNVCDFIVNTGEKNETKAFYCNCTLVDQFNKYCTFETTTDEYKNAVSSFNKSLFVSGIYHTTSRENAGSKTDKKKIFILKNTPVFTNITDSCIIDALYENGVILRPISIISFIVFSLVLLF